MTIQTNSGFIGAMVAGFVAGVLASEMTQFIGRLPKVIQKAAPIIIFPVLSLLLMQVIASLIIAPISGVIGDFFSMLLDAAMNTDAHLANTLAGAMMAVDMGGIINKVAYNCGVEGLAIGRTAFMASVMAGGMVPPIGVAISMWMFRKKYNQKERDRGISTLFMGLSFITEGVLPFVFTDLKRVIPACIAGSALAGLLSSVFGCTLPAPHGGIFVIPVMHNSLLYLLAIAAGSLLTAVILGRWKKAAVE
jgi:fructose-specific phosphotransferase system IIC component